MQSKATHGKRSMFTAAAVIAAAFMLGGCRSEAQTGALFGSGLGAGLGAIIGHQSGHAGEGALIGAGIGALGGYAIGNEEDKRRHRYYGHAPHHEYHHRPRYRSSCNYDY